MGDVFEIDHIIPASKELKTTYHNLQATHPRCNRIKGNRT